MTMKKIILAGLSAAVCFLIPQSAPANTNEISLDVLLTAQGNFTNATIIRHNPAYAMVDYPGGIVKVADSNLPPDLQNQFGYSPSNAAAFLNAEKEKKKQDAAAYAAKQAATAAYLASLAGTNRVIRIASIDDETRIMQVAAVIEGRNVEIFIRYLPDSVRTFVIQYNRTLTDIENTKQRIKNLKAQLTRAENNSTAAIAVGTSADYANASIAENNVDAAIQSAKDNLDELNSNLRQMKDDAPEKSAVIAYPSSEFWGDQQVWVCTGLAPPMTENSNQ
jgi:hypothetical protein